MSVSLLDLLSCGLAVVVILLMISLNSGLGSENQLNESTYIEITINNGHISDFIIQGKEINDTFKLKKEGDSFYYLDLPSKIDSLIGISITAVTKAHPPKGFSYSRVYQISIPPKANGVTLTMEVFGFGARDYAVEYFATNSFEAKKIIQSVSSFKANRETKINLRYSGGIKTWITNLADGKTIHNFPTLINEQ